MTRAFGVLHACALGLALAATACSDFTAVDAPSDSDVTDSSTSADDVRNDTASAVDPGDPPELASLSPAEGPLEGGSQIAGSGRHFTSPIDVLFGSVPASSVSLVDSRLLTILVPPGLRPGPVDVVVETRAGRSVLEDGFTYLPSTTPRASALDPDSGDVTGGDEVTVSGSNFPTERQIDVIFGGTPVTEVRVGTDAQFDVITPPHDAETVDVTFNFGGGVIQVLPEAFTFVGD